MRSLICLLFLINMHCIFAQKTDTTIFTSEFEKNIFLKFCDSVPVKPLDMLIAFQYASSSQDIEKVIKGFNASLEAKGIEKYSRKKEIKEIYNEVHSRFLKKYEEETYFNDIFTNGNYNCVTASALYALILDYFKIDYLVKETPNHVFLVADPNGTSFLIETTLPSKGVFQFDERFKKTYVEYLRNNKIISDNDFRTNSVDDLFGKFYETAKTIATTQLAALQYYNKGIFAYDAKDYATSANNFQKAVIIYPSTNIQFLYSNALLNLIVEQTGKKNYDGKILAQYINLNYASQEALQVSKDHFNGITNEMVINRPDIKGYTSFYNGLISNLNDSVDKTDYSQTYHTTMAYYYYLKNDYGKVLDHSTEAYRINPENIRTQQFVLEALIKYLQEDNRADEMGFDTIVGYSDKFPFLLNNEFYLKMVGYGITMNLTDYYRKANPAELAKALDYLQKLANKIKQQNISNQSIEFLYTETASELVRNHKYDDAETVLKKGIELVPGSSAMKSQLSTITASKKDLQKFIDYHYVETPTKQFITPPAYKEDEVDASVKKYIIACWNVDYYRKDGKTKETKVDQLKFIFYAGNKMKFKTGTEEHWGTWKLNPSGPTLELKSFEDKQPLTVLIYEASATQMRGILSPYKSENKKIEFNICEK